MNGKLIMTVEQMQNRDAWLAMRNKGIGGSEAAVIVGLSKWKSPFELWAEKTGQAEPEDLSDNEYIYWGTVLEQAVADRFCELTGKKVRRQGMLQDEEYPYMLANVDRMVVGENAGLECKTANGFKAKEWDGDNIPDAYYCQCQWYMMVTGADKWYIACLIGGNHFVWKEIPRNDADIEALRMAAVDFWANVETKTMPELDGSENCGKALAEKYSNVQKDAAAVLPSAAADWLAKLEELDVTEAEIKKQQEECKNQLKNMIGEAEIGMVGDRKITWKLQAGKTTIDSKRLKAEMPEVYTKYAKVSKPVRAFKYK